MKNFFKIKNIKMATNLGYPNIFNWTIKNYATNANKINKPEVVGLGPNSKLLKQYKESLGKLSKVQWEAAIAQDSKIISKKRLTRSIMTTGPIFFTLSLNHLVSNRLVNNIINRKGFSSDSGADKNPIVPGAVYLNPDLDKERIINENKGKSGTYCWTNLISGKTYVGSSVNLGRRIRYYYNYSSLTNPKNKMVINKALLSYGYSNFKLEVLEYCEPEKVISREQYYIDLLKPEYNLLKTAGSTWGYKHTEETLAKFRARTYSPEQLVKLKENLSKTNSEGQRAAARERMLKINEKKGIRVEVLDQDTNITRIYGSIREAAVALNSDKKALLYNEKVQKEKGIIKPFKKKFIVKILRD